MRFLFMLIFPLTAYAGWISQGDLSKVNRGEHGAKYWTRKSKCESATGQKCFDASRHNPQFHKLVGGKLQKDEVMEQVFKNKMSEKSLRRSKRLDRVSGLKTCVDALDSSVSDSVLRGCLKRAIVHLVDESLSFDKL